MNSDIVQNLHAALMIACIGMSVVMLFLTLMMGVMRITEVVMAKLNRWFPEKVKEEPKRNISSKNDEEIAVAIAAMMKHKNLLKGGK